MRSRWPLQAFHWSLPAVSEERQYPRPDDCASQAAIFRTAGAPVAESPSVGYESGP